MAHFFGESLPRSRALFEGNVRPDSHFALKVTPALRLARELPSDLVACKK